ncbi:carbohydrate esterase family 16 protein [Collybiopsis luxurians FD-317 M1]|uniref:Carbohydrate esterase family 16 protein n=1 Tax=Collybiopsis luxurians FD-317 M1 TaxID=944289 RepID=A0A0D0AQ53_9AGAR|nr:carbohydrate esterase family 16 protein [Collybiopsis luxurians FD-317 M1]
MLESKLDLLGERRNMIKIDVSGRKSELNCLLANGTVPVPPILSPPSPSAGSQFTENRRPSNGFILVEDMANELSAKLLNPFQKKYAWGGAVIDNFAYNTTTPLNATGVPRTDFVTETRKNLDALVPEETIYTVSFGINDDGQFKIADGNLTLAYETYVTKLGELQASGATNILVQGIYKHTPEIDILQNQVFAYLREANAVNGTNIAYVNLERLFDTIAADPAPFGFRGNATCLISANTIEGGCDDPDHSVFWIREFTIHHGSFSLDEDQVTTQTNVAVAPNIIAPRTTAGTNIPDTLPNSLRTHSAAFDEANATDSDGDGIADTFARGGRWKMAVDAPWGLS